MFKYSILFVTLMLISVSLSAQESLITLDPQRRAPTKQANIEEANILVTPDGAYARIDFTFKISAQKSYYKNTDTLEAVLNFNLPHGSFIHDSWLWLDDTHIIRADVVEKNRAISIYEGIVNRRRDPSLLIKTGENSYKLNVFPLTTSYPRKVKLSYSVPFNWNEHNAKVPLPTNILKTSVNLSSIVLNVDKNPLFTMPNFVSHDYNKHYIGVSGTKDVLMLYANDYVQKNILLEYTTPLSNGVSFTNYATGNNEGYFQLTIPPSSIGMGHIRNTVIVLDHTTNQSIYTQAEIINHLKQALLTNYNKIDSFNIFYCDNNKVVSAFNTWQPINGMNVDQAFGNIPANINTPAGSYTDLLVDALNFCNKKTTGEAEVLLASNNSNYTSSQTAADQLFNDIKTAIGGYTNKINVLNYSYYKKYISGKYYYANDILYNKFTLATGGTTYKYYSKKYSFVNGTYTYQYDLDAPNALYEIAMNFGSSTVAYNIDVNFNSGFTHSQYNVFNTNKIYFSRNNSIVGKYHGDPSSGVSVHIKAISPTGVIDTTYSINNVLSSSSYVVKEWNYKYIQELLGQNNPFYAQEIIDTSINNRVLCDLTAFLAVETGDTIATNIDDNPNAPTSTSTIESAKNKTLKAYPNPFTNSLTIELPEKAKTLVIYDVTGKQVFSISITTDQKKITWRGKDNTGNNLPSGVYLVIVQTETDRQVIRVIKQ